MATGALERDRRNKNELLDSVLRLGLHSDYLALAEGRTPAKKLIAFDPKLSWE